MTSAAILDILSAALKGYPYQGCRVTHGSPGDVALFLRFGRREANGLYTCMDAQLDSGPRHTFLVALSIIVHYFEECPHPSGAFGVDKGIVDLLDYQKNAAVLDRHNTCLGWLSFDQRRPEESFAAFWAEVSAEIEQHVRQVSDDLAQDTFRAQVYTYYMSLQQKQIPLPATRQELLARIAQFGTPAPLNAMRGFHYSVGKVTAQLWSKLQGRESWTEA